MSGEHAFEAEPPASAERGKEGKSAHRLHRAQVAVRNLRHVAGDLLQGPSQSGRTTGNQRCPTIGPKFTVTRQGSDEEEGHCVDDEAHECDDNEHDGGILISSVASHRSPHRRARDEPRKNRGEGRDGHHRDVAVGHVGELVREHALEFLLIEAAEEPGGHDDDRSLVAASGGEGVRHIGISDAHPRLVHIGERAQPVDDGM